MLNTPDLEIYEHHTTTNTWKLLFWDDVKLNVCFALRLTCCFFTYFSVTCENRELFSCHRWSTYGSSFWLRKLNGVTTWAIKLPLSYLNWALKTWFQCLLWAMIWFVLCYEINVPSDIFTFICSWTMTDLAVEHLEHDFNTVRSGV